MTEKEYEKRRYEIARDCLAAFISCGSDENGWATPECGAKDAVDFADALLAELDKKK